MAVVSREIATAILELRSAALTLIAVVLKTIDLDALATDLERRASAMPGLFEDEPVAVDLSCVRDVEEPVRFTELIALLRRHRMVPVAARGGNAEQMAAAFAAGLVEAPESARPARGQPQGPPVVLTECIVEVQLPARPPMIVDRPLRSGQQLYARDCDLVVLALVSHGAEVIADGHIHVYAPLRGRAIAGARGNTEARILSLCLEPELISIAGVYRTSEVPLPADVLSKPTQVRLVGGAEGKLVMAPLQ